MHLLCCSSTFCEGEESGANGTREATSHQWNPVAQFNLVNLVSCLVVHGELDCKSHLQETWDSHVDIFHADINDENKICLAINNLADQYADLLGLDTSIERYHSILLRSTWTNYFDAF